MIDIPQAVLLGIIQGLSEFIPISSTAHLRVVPALLGKGDPGAAYSAVIQLGTLLSLLVYFRNDLIVFTKAVIDGLKTKDPWKSQDARMAYYMVIGTVPISAAGLLLSDFISGTARSLYVISGALIGLAAILFAADRTAKKSLGMDAFTWKDALWVGIAQCFALIPGASRAGTTLTMGLILGYNRESAMRFSFLLSIPAIGLSGVYELIQEREQLFHLGFEGLIVGTAVSGIVGYLTIAGLLRFLRTHTTTVFVVYRILLGLSILYLVQQGIVPHL